jgi:hypothetical protein
MADIKSNYMNKIIVQALECKKGIRKRTYYFILFYSKYVTLARNIMILFALPLYKTPLILVIACIDQ